MKKNKNIIAVLVALLASALFSIILKWIQTGNPISAETVLVGGVVFLNIVILGVFAHRLFQKYSNKPSEELKKTILRSFVFFVLEAFVVSLTLVSVGVYMFYIYRGVDTSDFLHNLIYLELPVAIRQFAVWVMIGSTVFFYIIWQKAVDREQKLREDNLKYKYRNLKEQVNPHFLFNSLNTLSELVYTDAGKADSYIQKLSGIYRYVLENENNDMVPLDIEIDFVKKYFALQKERDGDKIQLKINLEDSETFHIIPASLQMLVENALKHNSRSVNDPLKIQISLENGYIKVVNNIRRKNTLEQPSKTGLANIRSRIKLLTGKDLIVIDDSHTFDVEMPLMMKNI